MPGLLDLLAQNFPSLFGAPARPRSLLDTTDTNPIGTSSIYPPQVLTNPDPNVSLVVDPVTMTTQARLGTLLQGKRNQPVTAAELPAAEDRAQTAVDYGMAVAGATNPIRVFHGSPHRWANFDMSKIGTGTGLHAYSPGAYFATAENNAAGYSRGLSSAENLTPFQIFKELNRAAIASGLEPAQARQVADNVISGIMDSGTPARYVRNYDIPTGPFEAPYKAAIEKAKALGVAARRNMYEVNLNVDKDDLLNWNAGANQQAPGVLERLRSAGVNVDSSAPYQPRTMEEVTRLRDAGIPGLRYTGEGATEAAPNYVMWRGDVIDILRRYGLLGMVGGGAGAGLLGAPEQ